MLKLRIFWLTALSHTMLALLGHYHDSSLALLTSRAGQSELATWGFNQSQASTIRRVLKKRQLSTRRQLGSSSNSSSSSRGWGGGKRGSSDPDPATGGRAGGFREASSSSSSFVQACSLAVLYPAL
eukprot:jgi/Mesen1/3501/ME000197S02522